MEAAQPGASGEDEFARWYAEKDTTKIARGYDEADSKWRADCKMLSDLAEEIAGIPSMTMEGIKIKARLQPPSGAIVACSGS